MPKKKIKEKRLELEEIYNPAKWLNNVKRKNAKRNIKWTINKEKIYEQYKKFKKRYVERNDLEDRKFLSIEVEQIEVGSKKDIPGMKYHSIIVVLPDGKIITPIRQFCEVKVLPPGVKEAYFYNFAEIPMDAYFEPPEISQPKLTKKECKTEERGTMVSIKYPIEEHHIDLVASMNRSFSLESINDENRAVLNLCMNNEDMFGHWINHEGKQIVNDAYMKGNLSFKAIAKAMQIIMDEGLDTSNIVLATSGKGIRDLTLDPDLDKFVERYNENHPYKRMDRPYIITQALIEEILGIKIFATNATNYSDFTTRSVLFIPNVAFGIVCGEELQMEGKKKLRPKAVFVTGTERVTAILKNKEAVVRISHG